MADPALRAKKEPVPAVVREYLKAQSRKRWNEMKPLNTWKNRAKGLMDPTDAEAWDCFYGKIPDLGPSEAAEEDEEGSPDPPRKKPKKDKTFFIDPKRLREFGFDVGKRYVENPHVVHGGRPVGAGAGVGHLHGRLAAACFPHNTRFVHSNFVQEPPATDQLGVGANAARFDVVSCFSTSKWVHLNFGDEGLRTLFKRAYACLRPGGRFLLEPQPWSSYRKRAGLTPTIKRHFESIRIRPDAFCAILTSDVVGFASADVLDVPYGDDAGKNFQRRPLIVCVKAPSS